MVLLELLDQENLSQRELARRAGVDKGLPGRIIKGDRAITAEDAKAFARGFATTRRGIFNQEKYQRYATLLLRPLGLAPISHRDGGAAGG